MWCGGRLNVNCGGPFQRVRAHFGSRTGLLACIEGAIGILDDRQRQGEL